MSGVAWTDPYRLAGLGCFLVGVLVYINTLNCGFCFDDKAALLENRDIRPASSWSSVWKNDFWGTPLHLNTSHKSYRPLCVATFRLNYLLHELQPMGYHLVNILLHGAVCYLYVQLCGLIFSRVWPALIAGLLFAVHPIHTEAVAGIVGRADLMAALFFLLSLLAYHRAAVECHNKPGYTHHSYLVVSLALSLCSVLSKESGLTVIGVCIVYDLFLLQQNTFLALLNLLGQLVSHQSHKPHPLPSWFRWFLWRLLAITVFTGGVLGIRLWMMVTPPVFNKMDNEALSLESPYRQLHWAHLTFVNSHLLLNPSRLLHDYRMKAIPLITSLSDPRNILTLITISAYIILGLYSLMNFDLYRCASVQLSKSNGHIVSKERTAVSSNRLTSYYSNEATLQSSDNHKKWCYRSPHILLFGLTLIVFPYLPASNLFFPVGFVVAERVLYLPSMGLCLLVGYGAYQIFIRKSSKLTSGLCLALVAGLLLTNAAKTFTRNKDWSSKVMLYGSLLQQYPSNGHILANVAREYCNIDKYEKAELAYRMGMKLAPNMSINFINLGFMLKNQQKLKASEEVLFETIDMLKRTLDHDPENMGKLANVYVSVSGIVGKDASRLDEALELVEEALKLNSSLSGAHNSRGSFLLRKGLLHESVDEFRQAIQLQPTSTNAHYNMAIVYRQRGEMERALSSLQKVLAIDPSHALANAAVRTLKQAV